MFQEKTPWLPVSPAANDQIRIFCFPFAGGGASSYRDWQKFFPKTAGVYPIQLPGRENRIADQLFTDMVDLAAEISKVLRPYLTKPFVFFGHSLGARIAFEVVRVVRRNWQLEPCHLIVSGSRAPHIPEPKPLHHLTDEDFVNELRRFSGTPEAILQNKELMELFIPILRADFMVDETYVYLPEEPIACPISAFGGTADPEAEPSDLAAWQQHTSNSFNLEMIEGDHFFLQSNKDVLLNFVKDIVLKYSTARRIG